MPTSPTTLIADLPTEAGSAVAAAKWRGPGVIVGSHVALLILIVGAAFFGMEVATVRPTNLSAIWLPSGIALVAMILKLHWSAIPTIWLANWVVMGLRNDYDFIDIRPFGWFVCAINTLQPALAYAFWRLWIHRPPFSNGARFLRFTVGVAFLPAALTSWMIIAALVNAGYLRGRDWPELISRASITTLSDTLGIFLVVAVALAPWRDVRGRTGPHYWLQLAAAAAATTALCWAGFALLPAIIFGAIPLVLGAGITSGPRGVAIAVFLIVVIGQIATAAGHGPFAAADSRFQPILAMAAFSFALAIPAMFAGIVLSQLNRYRSRLETRVGRRATALRNSEERYANALESLTDGLFDWTIPTGAAYCNPPLASLLRVGNHVPPSNLRNLIRRVHPPDRRPFRRALLDGISGRAPTINAEFRLAHDTEDRWFRLRARAVDHTPTGRTLRLVGTTTEITTEKQRTLEMATAREAAEAAACAKAQFLGSVSHELRTPMNGVLGFARLLDSTDLDATQKDFTGAIVSSGQTLLTLLDDILDASQITNTTITLNPTAVATHECFRDALEPFRKQAEAVGLAFHFAIDPAVPPTLVIDVTRTRQILANLLSNALKFTHSGGVSVRVTATAADSDEVDLTIDVHDTGIGIPEHQIDHIFESFSQADSSSTRRYGGTGLGLPISRRLCQIMRGSLTVRSAPGRGSTFTARIRAGTGEPPNTIDDGAVTTPTRPLRVLVAEDNPLNRKLITFLLRRLGHSCEFAFDGAQAAEMATASRYDLILMDIQMPEMDGLASTRLIRAREAAARQSPTPIIAVTAAAAANDRSACLAAGMNEYLPKPINFSHIAAAIARVTSPPTAR